MSHGIVGPQAAGQKVLPESRWTELADLSSRRARAEFIRQHVELVQPDVVSRLAGLVPHLAKSNRNKALAIADMAVMIANRLDDPPSVALGLRATANALYASGQNEAAIEYHRSALRLFRSLGNREQVARTLSSSIQPLILQGRYALALAAAREARNIFKRQGNSWRLARLDLNVGNILDRQDRFRDALQCYERAYKYLSLDAQNDPEAVAVALHNMAVSYVSLNDFRKAEATYDKARTFAAAHDMPVLVGQADYNIAWLHYLRGDYTRAISMLRAARETCYATGDEYHFALSHLDLSEIYLELNLSLEAAEAAEQGGTSFSHLGMQYERAKSIVNLAIALSQQGAAVRALELFLQARQIVTEEKNKVLPSVIDLYRALVLYGEKRDAEARRLSTVALHAFQRSQLTSKAIVCRLLLARLDLRVSDLRSAQDHCSQALKSLTRLELPVLSCQGYALRGQIHAIAGREQQSYRAYRRASEYLERLRNNIHGEELKISFMKDRVEIYEGLVFLRMKHTGRPRVMEEIFGYIQQAKSRTLLDVLSTSRSASWLAPQGQSEHAQRIRQLREELNWYFHKTEIAQLQGTSHHHLTRLRAESYRRERELLKLLREHVRLNDKGAGLQLATTCSVDQVRKSLPRDAAILEYFQVQGQVVVTLLSHDQFRIVPLAEVSQIAILLDFLQLHLSKLRLDRDYVTKFAAVLLSAVRTHLQELYKVLVEPIRGSLAASHLVVAPHGILHNLPFQALFDGSQYLIDEFTVSYAPSASVYALCQARTRRAAGGALVLGVPDAAAPFVQEEVEAVAACLPHCEVLLGKRATAQSLCQKGTRSRVVHIATHGYFRRDNPMFSGIRLGDSYLSLYDLYQLKFSAELVGLSGCSTGLNVVAAGDELLGLARGLIQAGVETSMLTLWDVQDQSSAQLMKFFYGNLASGCGKAQALRHAMRQLKLERPHPYYWAPFILVGKT